MASVDATAFDNTIAESRRWPMRRVLAAFAVALALLSAFLTFVVLTGLTPVEPSPEVVVTFLLINSAAIDHFPSVEAASRETERFERLRT